ncbi:MAG: hypothetical protein ACLFWF_00285 [Alphaproteobacteria bacterium]
MPVRIFLWVLGTLYALAPGVLGLLEPWGRNEVTMASGKPVEPQTACLVGDSLYCRSSFDLKIARSHFQHPTFWGRNEELDRALEGRRVIKVWYDRQKCLAGGCLPLAIESDGKVLVPFRTSSNFELGVTLFCLLGAAACFILAGELSPQRQRRKERKSAETMRKRLERRSEPEPQAAG